MTPILQPYPMSHSWGWSTIYVVI